MRNLLAFVLMIALVGSAAAYDLGNQSTEVKSSDHVLQNPGTPSGRQGGEDMASALVISAWPYSDTGTTTGYMDDYDVACSVASTSPDVVYSYTPATDEVISVDLCGSLYDTKVFILDGDMNAIACDDDFYPYGDPCGDYTSYIEGAALTAGTEYFIVIDGYFGDAGEYTMVVDEGYIAGPCEIVANDDEGEPAISDGYVDTWNSGCNDDSGLFPFQELEGDVDGMLTFGGTAAFYTDGDLNSRDTDWYIATLGETGILEWTLDAEVETFGFELAPQNCTDVEVAQDITAGPCNPAVMTVQGNPGDLVWLWVGATEFVAPAGFEGYEYPYICEFEGLAPGVIATENVSFDGIKSLYR